MIKLKSVGRQGIPEQGIILGDYEVFLSDAARASLLASGCVVKQLANDLWSVVPGPIMPADLELVHVAMRPYDAVRLVSERFDQETPAPWWDARFTPCPDCGSPVVWYEAGYVPGYRVCTGKDRHHSCIE